MSGPKNVSELKLPERTHHLVYTLITNQLATYQELRDVYDIEEVLDLYEICMVSLHNKVISMKGVDS